MNPYEMKVFKVNENDWIAAKTKNDAVAWYYKEFGDDANVVFVQECDVEKDKMWYGFTLGEMLDYFEFRRRLQPASATVSEEKKRIKFPEHQSFEVRVGYGDYDYSVRISFQDAIYLDQKDEPYLICSTEY